MIDVKNWTRIWFTREVPLGDTPLTASFEKYSNGVIGIHISDCFVDGILCDEAIEIVNRFGSRTEYDMDGTGINILVRGEPVMYDGYTGLEIDTYYLTGKTIVYKKIVKNQEAFEWLHFKYMFFVLEEEEYVSPYYFRHVEMDGDVLKISYPEIREGHRHVDLLSYGGRMISEGFSEQQIRMKLYDMNVLYCVPPLDPVELEKITNTILKYKENQNG